MKVTVLASSSTLNDCAHGDRVVAVELGHCRRRMDVWRGLDPKQIASRNERAKVLLLRQLSRPPSWYKLSGAAMLRRKCEVVGHTYAVLRETCSREDRAKVAMDAQRTFAAFGVMEKQNILRCQTILARMLCALCSLDSDCGYCQVVSNKMAKQNDFCANRE